MSASDLRRVLSPVWLTAVIALAATGVAWGATKAAAPAPAKHVEATLIVRALPDGEVHSLWVGVRLRHAPGWHTYWKNPGDSGMPTKIEWHLPESWIAGPIDWPAPQRIVSGGLASYGYLGQTVLPVRLSPPASWSSKVAVHLAATVSWLVCRDICIPETTEVAIDLPVKLRRADELDFERAMVETPEAFSFASARAWRADGRFQLRLDPGHAGEFFPDMEELIDAGVAVTQKPDGSAVLWSAALGEAGRHLVRGTRISGVWVERGHRPRTVEATLDTP